MLDRAVELVEMLDRVVEQNKSVHVSITKDLQVFAAGATTRVGQLHF